MRPDVWPPVTALLLSVLVLGPMLRPGSPLRYDLVSVPRQVLSLDALGLGDRLPRAVPLDAATWLLGFVLGGWVSQALALTALLLAGWGAALLVDAAPAARLVATVVAICNPFVLEQLAIGHVPHLVSYGCLPWAALAGYRLADARGPAPGLSWGPAAGLAAVMLLGSLTPGGGLLCAGAALAGLLAGRARGSAGRVLAGVAIAAAAQAPWLVAGLVHPGLGTGSGAQAGAGVADFSVRAESAAGRVVDTLGLGGMWNASALPASRSTWLSLAGTVLLLASAGLGLTRLLTRPLQRRRAVLAGAGLALAGYLVALLPVLPGGEGLLGRLVRAVPAAGLLRDGHRWLAWPAIAVAVLAGYAADRAGAWWAARSSSGGSSSGGSSSGGSSSGRVDDGTPAATGGRIAAAVLLAALAVASVPDLFGGLAGRLAARQYPADWAAARTVLEQQPDRARILVLPWQPFRRFGWTDGTTVLDPAPRYLPREAVVSDALRVGRRTLPEEGPLARRMATALADDRLTEAELRDAGIGWVLVERGTPGRLPALPTAAVLDGPDLQLSRLPGELPVPGPVPASRRVPVLVGLLVPPVGLVLLAGSALVRLIRRYRRELLLGYPPVIGAAADRRTTEELD